jgi:hypothetical protein
MIKYIIIYNYTRERGLFPIQPITNSIFKYYYSVIFRSNCYVSTLVKYFQNEVSYLLFTTAETINQNKADEVRIGI